MISFSLIVHQNTRGKEEDDEEEDEARQQQSHKQDRLIDT